VRAPAYTEAGIIDFATAEAGVLTVNSLAVIHGSDLSYETKIRSAEDLLGGKYQTALPGANVSVRMGGIATPVEFASPKLIIFVVPANLAAGRSDVQVVRQGVAGPRIRVEVRAERPLLYPAEDGFVLARHAESGEWIESRSPARPGEEVLLYAGGLGQLVPPLRELQAPLARLPLEKGAAIRVWLDGVAFGRPWISYAGAVPGYAGIYEIRFRLPVAVSEDPEVRLTLEGLSCPAALRLPLRYATAQPEAARPR